MNHVATKKPNIMRWVLVSALMICVLVALVVHAKADHLINDEPSLTSAALERPADMRVLMLGNSLIYWQDTDVMLERLAASKPGGPKLVVGRIARPYYSLHDHSAELYADGPWRRWNIHRKVFEPFSDSPPRWDALIVHERSGMASAAGINDRDADGSASDGAAIAMAARSRGTQLILMASWGYMRGALPADDATFRRNFPDFQTMNKSMDRGYTIIADKIEAELATQTQGAEEPRAPAPQLKIARVGRTFAQAWEEDVAAGREPLAEGALFRGLYDDPNHPSVAGAYLSAAVLLVTLTGQPCSAATWVPEGLSAEEARRLRAFADAQLAPAPAEHTSPPATNAPHKHKGPPPTRPQTTPPT